MKQWTFLFLAAASVTGVGAQELGRVISSIPVVQQMAVPRQVCTTEQIGVQQPNSGAGAFMGMNGDACSVHSVFSVLPGLERELDITERAERFVQICRAYAQIHKAGQDHVPARPAHTIEP